MLLLPARKAGVTFCQLGKYHAGTRYRRLNVTVCFDLLSMIRQEQGFPPA